MGWGSWRPPWMYGPPHSPPASDAPPDRGFIERMSVHYRQHNEGIIMSTATLTWTLPTTRTDATALQISEIASVDVIDDAGGTTNVPGAATTFTTGTLTVGTHNFTVVVNDTTGHKSAPSNTASVTVQATLANPSAVSDLAATLNP